jgi:hypothetical protein
MEMAGRSRMLLVLLLGGQRLETSGIAVSDCPSPEKTDTQFSVSLAQERRLRQTAAERFSYSLYL